jgi:hypothetical protein
MIHLFSRYYASKTGKQLSELATRARILAAKTDHERMLIRTRALRRELGLPESEALL